MPEHPSSSTPVVLELFMLDAPSCQPCWSAEISIHAAARTLRRLLDPAQFVVATRVVTLDSADQAHRLGIVSSPTVRVDGHDVALEVEEEPCSSCSDIAGTAIECRTYLWSGRRFDHAPAELIVDAALRRLVEGLPRAVPGPMVASTAATSVDRFLGSSASRCC